jgi:hypothetical protein
VKYDVGFTREEYREFMSVCQRAPVGSIVRCPVIMERRGDIVVSVCGAKLTKPEGFGVVMCDKHQQEAHEAMHRDV